MLGTRIRFQRADNLYVRKRGVADNGPLNECPGLCAHQSETIYQRTPRWRGFIVNRQNATQDARTAVVLTRIGLHGIVRATHKFILPERMRYLPTILQKTKQQSARVMNSPTKC